MPNKELKEIEGAIEEVKDRIARLKTAIESPYQNGDPTGRLRKEMKANQVALSCMELVKEILDDKILLNEVKELGLNIEHRYQQIRRGK